MIAHNGYLLKKGEPVLCQNADYLKKNLEEYLKLPHEAVEWLMMMWRTIQFFDDVYDQSLPDKQDTSRVLWDVLFAMPTNLFFSRNAGMLYPVMCNAILKWSAANNREGDCDVDESTFVWRASYYDVVLTVVQICFGAEYTIANADKVLGLYGESFGDYKKEFKDA